MRIEIPEKPIPKARHRSVVFGGGVHTYDPQKKDRDRVRGIITSLIQSMFDSSDKSKVMEASALLYSDVYSIDITFYIGHSASITQIHKNRLRWGFSSHTDKPDVDNFVKFYLDCANGVLFADDKQIVEIKARKVYSSNPRTVIEIMGKNHVDEDELASGILGTLSPTEFKSYLEIVHELGLFGMDMDEEGYCRGMDQSSKLSQQWRAKAAGVLSEFAEKFTPYLLKIRKKWPNFYEKHEKVVEFKKALKEMDNAAKER